MDKQETAEKRKILIVRWVIQKILLKSTASDSKGRRSHTTKKFQTELSSIAHILYCAKTKVNKLRENGFLFQ